MARIQFFAEEALTVSSTAVGFTSSAFVNADYAHVYVDGADIRMFFGGGTPTASTGIPVSLGDEIILEGKDEVSKARFIRSGGGDAVLRANFGVRNG
jgi:hypothetical protein